jgi:hypothetical protein
MPVTEDSLDAVLADRLTRAARAAQDLCDVLWEALHEELSDRSPNGPRAQRVADLSERVADVSSTVSALAGYARRGVPAREPSAPAEPAPGLEPSLAPEPSSAAPEPPAVSTLPVATSSGAVIVDEHAENAAPLPATGRFPGDALQRPPTAYEQPPTAYEQPPTAHEQQARARPLPWDEPLSEEMRVTRRTVEEPAAAPSPPDSPF